VNRDNKLADFALWEEIRRTVRPLGVKTPQNIGARSGQAAVTRRFKMAEPVQHQNLPAPHQNAQLVPPLQTLDRRTAQRLGRGQLEPDARLDLHGDSLETARTKLEQFIALQRQQGARLVLVITGKGASPFARHTLHGHSHFHAPEREGRLRREVPRWFGEEQFRQHIVGFQPSHPRHGGGGAYYVRLRKKLGAWL
jgi:DNA-nicking Smr family endonuclease